jgi:hypothetical protein
MENVIYNNRRIAVSELQNELNLSLETFNIIQNLELNKEFACGCFEH